MVDLAKETLDGVTYPILTQQTPQSLFYRLLAQLDTPYHQQLQQLSLIHLVKEQVVWEQVSDTLFMVMTPNQKAVWDTID